MKNFHLVIVGIVLACVAAWYVANRPRFPDLQGPDAATRLPQASDFAVDFARDVASLPQHGNAALALLVTEPDSSWYGLASGLGGLGIPFRVHTDVSAALQHDVVMVYPRLSGANTSAVDLQAIAAHARNGGTVLAFAVLGGGMQEVFGFESAVERPSLSAMQFVRPDSPGGFVQSEADARLELGSGSEGSGSPGVSYVNPAHPPVAVYDDGSVAITHKIFDAPGGSGHAYAIGPDIGHFILQAHNGRHPSAGDNYVNAYRPQIDTVLRFIADVYRDGEPDAVMLAPTPAGKDVTILMTHDVDFTRSIVNAPAYAEVERAAGVPATYFIQTKYLRDYNDDYFLDPARSVHLNELVALGMEIGSHSVAHSRVFDELEIGTGTERYPEYRPFVDGQRSVKEATILGELRVSKFLLDALTGQGIEAFRPGHLSHPRALPQLLQATGFRYSSSMTANEARTHLPFRQMYDRAYAAPVGVIEFPVTIEDESGRLGDRLDDAIAVTKAISRYRGLVTLLIHTDVLDHKLEFTREYIDAFRDTAWFDTVSGYGDWWAAREAVAVDVSAGPGATRFVHLRSDQAIDGLTLEVPAGWTHVPQTAPAGTRQQGSWLALREFSGELVLEFAVPDN